MPIPIKIVLIFHSISKRTRPCLYLFAVALSSSAARQTLDRPMTVRNRRNSRGRLAQVELVEMMAVIFGSQGQELERQEG